MNVADWLSDCTILVTMAGSRAYGTSRPDSDVDIKGICIPPRCYRDGFLHSFEQADGKDLLKRFTPLLKGDVRNTAEEKGLDGVVFGLAKFFKLASDCNPNVIEALFTDPEDILFVDPLGQKLLDARQDFLSKKALHTFRGYAMSQLKRIRTHRKWLLDPPGAPPTRIEYGLLERTTIPKDQLQAVQAVISKRIDSWEVDFGSMADSEKIHVRQQMEEHLTEMSIGADEKFASAARLSGVSDNFLDLLERERRYGAARTNWTQYNDWKTDRNKDRAALEAKYGFDAKHAMHLVRLMTMCREILTEGCFRVRRPDAEFLSGIRDGAWSYDRLIEWAEAQDTALVTLAEGSTLPRQPDRAKLDLLCRELTMAKHG